MNIQILPYSFSMLHIHNLPYERVNWPDRDHLAHTSPPEKTPVESSDMASNFDCKTCGLLFKSAIDVNRHMLRNCAENRKRFRDDELTSNETFQKLVKRARLSNEQEYNDLVHEYVEGLSEDEARSQAEQEINDLDTFMHNYKQLVAYTIGLQESDIHNDIIDEVNELIDRGRTLKSAIKKVVKKEYFEELFESESDSEDEEDDGEEAEEEQTDEETGRSDGFDSEDDIPLSELIKK